ncbi:MAG: hypothetical protein ABJO97_22715 [Roseibium sp.]|uniref:hypothetical protein n=1 Tax=Roseibium sp. TaxID=1936156 RepID=UPI0032675EB7
MILPDQDAGPTWPQRPYVPQPKGPLDGWIFKVAGWGLIVSSVCLAALGVDAVMTALFFN